MSGLSLEDVAGNLAQMNQALPSSEEASRSLHRTARILDGVLPSVPLDNMDPLVFEVWARQKRRELGLPMDDDSTN